MMRERLRMENDHWTLGTWINEPVTWSVGGDVLTVTTDAETDFWRHTAYGFVRHSGHVLASDFPEHSSLEITVSAEYTEPFDQAGIMVWADERNWVKCGLEYAAGELGFEVVVTRDLSDWSTIPVPEWAGESVVIRVSRTADSLTIRAKTATTPWRLVRLAPLDSTLNWKAGPHAATPTRQGLEVAFSARKFGPPDESVH